jgi:acyl-coenzyme A thioesterase PaaI-like protein
MASGLETGTTVRTAPRQDTGWLLPGPVEGRLGMRVTAMSPDGSRIRMPIPPDSPAGEGSTGEVAAPERTGLVLALNVLADTAGGIALSAHQGIGVGGPTIELRLDHVAAPADGAGWLVGEGALLHEAGGAGYLSISVADDTGRVLVRAVGHYLSLPRSSTPSAPGPDAETGDAGAELGCPADEVDNPAALVQALAPAGDDPALWVLPAAAELANPRDDVHGGALLTIGQLAQQRFVHADAAAGEPLTPLSVQAQYLLPAPADGSELSCRTEYVRRGRAFRTVRTELVRPDGRVATVVSGLWSAVNARSSDH